jgi:hypothetical protein
MTRGSFWTSSTLPSDSSLPWCSTVTCLAMRLHEVHVVFDHDNRFAVGDALEQFSRLSRSRGLMPATGSSSSSSWESCISSMPISSHCFWPCESFPAFMRRWSLSNDFLGDCNRCVLALPPCRGGRAGSPDAMHLGIEISRVLGDGEVFVDRRGLELAADTPPHDLVAQAS